MQKVYIVGAVRTPIGSFLGGLSSLGAVELANIAVKEAISRTGIKPEDVENVVGGIVYKAGLKGNPARQVQVACGIPIEASASTVDQQCASSMRAMEIAAMEIALGKNDVAVAFGTESMSNTPNLIMNAKTGSKIGPLQVEDSLLYDALNCGILGYHMGNTAETLAEQYSISRQEQDEFALASHNKAVKAQDAGLFDEEIVPVEIKSRKGSQWVSKDESPRPDISLEKLSSLRPAFKKDGFVTAGNASSMNDGAACVILVSERKMKELGLEPMAEILCVESYGVAPEVMGIGPAKVVPKVLAKMGLEIDEIDTWEINEAFASQCIAVNRELKIPLEKINPLGSGISLGHPVGCTGIRIIVTLLHHMKRNDMNLGVASLCVGGGPAMATILRNMNEQ